MTCSKYWIFMSNFPAAEHLISKRINNNIFLETSKSLCIPLYPMLVLGGGLVSIVTRQHVDSQWIMVCSSRGSKFLSSPLCADQLWGPPNILPNRGWGPLLPVSNVSRIWNWPRSFTTKTNNSLLPYVGMVLYGT